MVFVFNLLFFNLSMLSNTCCFWYSTFFIQLNKIATYSGDFKPSVDPSSGMSLRQLVSKLPSFPLVPLDLPHPLNYCSNLSLNFDQRKFHCPCIDKNGNNNLNSLCKVNTKHCTKNEVFH